MNLSPMAKKISELPSFVGFSEKQVRNENGTAYIIEGFKNADGVYKYNLAVLDQNSNVLKTFEIESYLNRDSKMILEGITK